MVAKKLPCFDDNLFGGASKLSLFAIKNLSHVSKVKFPK
jgi:hypothetical protein